VSLSDDCPPSRPFAWKEATILLAVLAATAIISLPNMRPAGGPGDTMVGLCETNEKNLGVALELYSTDNAGHYPPSMSFLIPKYIRIMPTCPAAGTDSYSATYREQRCPDAYSFYCQGANHRGATGYSNYPEYNSTQGINYGH
jgi:hypothetical protein